MLFNEFFIGTLHRNCLIFFVLILAFAFVIWIVVMMTLATAAVMFAFFVVMAFTVAAAMIAFFAVFMTFAMAAAVMLFVQFLDFFFGHGVCLHHFDFKMKCLAGEFVVHVDHHVVAFYLGNR
jgi:hypothetical protein